MWYLWFALMFPCLSYQYTQKQRLFWRIFKNLWWLFWSSSHWQIKLLKTWHFLHSFFPRSSGIWSTPDSRTQRTTNLDLTAFELKCVEFLFFCFCLCHSNKTSKGCQEILHVRFMKPQAVFAFMVCIEADFLFPVGVLHSGSWNNWNEVRSLLCSP